MNNLIKKIILELKEYDNYNIQYGGVKNKILRNSAKKINKLKLKKSTSTELMILSILNYQLSLFKNKFNFTKFNSLQNKIYSKEKENGLRLEKIPEIVHIEENGLRLEKVPEKVPIKTDVLVKIPEIVQKVPEKVLRNPYRNSNTFYVYTTGIADFCNIETIVNEWNEYLRDIVLKNIHDNFNKIIITHYDPLESFDIDLQNTFKKQFEETGILNTITTINRQIVSCVLYTNIDLNQIKNPHILLDFAHIIEYLPSDDMQKQIKLNDTIYNINSVYFGYIGVFQLENNYSDVYIAKSNFFTTSPYGTVITYIDKIYDNHLNEQYDIIQYKQFDNNNPQKVILYIFSLITKKMYHHLSKDDASLNNIINLITALRIVNLIIDKIMTSENLTFEIIVSSIFDENIIKIINSKHK